MGNYHIILNSKFYTNKNHRYHLRGDFY